MKHKSNYSGGGANPNNSISKDINYGVRKARYGMPPLKLVGDWRREYDKSDCRFTMMFSDYKRIKNRFWRKKKEVAPEKIANIWKKEYSKKSD